MLMVIPNEGKQFWLSRALSLDTYAPQNGYYVLLFANDYTPVAGSTLADFTEATFTGYARVNLALGNFGAPAIVANVAESTSSVPVVFSCSGGSPETVYGWLMIDNDETTALAAQRFNTPRVMNTGAVESIDPFKFKFKTFA